MKPLNLDNRPCSPISSNCVVWQGPTLDCINLCTGDTISDVVAKMAEELCTLLDQTNVANYDLSCLGITACGPKDFQALIQLLIEKICELNNLPTDGTRTEGACPDCVITVATCLRETDQGLPVTMQLIDYVQVLANKICSLIDQIGDLQEQVNNLDIRVTVLENTPPPTFDIPSFTLTSCAVGSLSIGSTPQINILLQEFINNVWCPFYDATGTTTELINAVNAICIEDSDLQLTTGTAFGLNPNWVQSSSYNTVADAINNIWVALCDVYNYILDLGSTAVAAGEGITVTSATVGSTTTYTVINDYLEVFTANVTINNNFVPGSGVIPKVVPSSVSGVEDGQVIFRYTSVLSNDQLVVAGTGAFVPNADLPPITFGSFNNTTGLFTITDPGTYLIKATIHLKPDNGSTVFWSGETTYSTPPTVEELRDNFNAIGSFYIGIHPNNNTDTFVASSQTMTPSIDKNVEISTSKVITATNPTTLRVKVLNTTNRNYDGTSYAGADGISFSITKLRSGLSITNL
jgi:hypothetical protein